MISKAFLDFCIKNNYNVIFRGKHGVGKTATVLEAFNRHGLVFESFSASTLDPHLHLIGVPKEKVSETGVSYLDLVRPQQFAEDKINAIFFDEYNRASKKVRNAVMELIQFKSINGKKFNNLRMVWAAINPDDDEDDAYDVEKLDPAQLDRFHVIYDVPYSPDASYFRAKYGKETADAAINWWKELSKEQKNKVSPRRLDYTIDIYSNGGDVKYVLPNGVNTNKLILELANGPTKNRLIKLFESKNSEEAKSFLTVENNFDVAKEYIIKTAEYREFFLPLVPDEKLIGLMTANKDVKTFVFTKVDKYESIIRNLANANSGSIGKEAKKIVSTIDRAKALKTANSSGGTLINGFITATNFPVKFTTQSSQSLRLVLMSTPKRFDNTQERIKVYGIYDLNMPTTLESDLASVAVQDLANIALRTQNNKWGWGNFPDLIPLLNHACNYFITTSQPLPLPFTDLHRIATKYHNFIFQNPQQGVAGGPKRRFEYKNGSSQKFWESQVNGKSYIVTYGRLGTNGTTHVQHFSTPNAAQNKWQNEIQKKISKGYVEV